MARVLRFRRMTAKQRRYFGPRKRRATRRRYRNPDPSLILAGNPRRRRYGRRSIRRSYRRHNPGLGSLTAPLRHLDFMSIAGAVGGFAGNLMVLPMMPAAIRKPGLKYIALVGLPLAARFILKGKLGQALFTGGMVAAGAHVLNDFVFKGKLLPSGLAAGTMEGYQKLGEGDVGEIGRYPRLGEGTPGPDVILGDAYPAATLDTPETRTYQQVGNVDRIPSASSVEADLTEGLGAAAEEEVEGLLGF